MKLLELFSGTQSVGKVARELGFDVLCLDRDMPADIKADILDWDYRQITPGSYQVIWASPPCTEYSRAKTVGVRNLNLANKIVKRTLEIIEYLQPKYFIIENPQTGLLKDQEFMRDIPYNDVDYCRYGMRYRKRTRLWNNLSDYEWEPRPLCQGDCGSVEHGRHVEVAQRGRCKGERTGKQSHKQSELYVVPSDLITELLEAIQRRAAM